MTPSGHHWIQGQGSGPRLTNKDNDDEDKFDAMGNKVEGNKKKKALTSGEARKKKKERMARRKKGGMCTHCNLIFSKSLTLSQRKFSVTKNEQWARLTVY